MNTCQIAEFAALFASQSSQIIESPQPIRNSRLQAVWTTSRSWLTEVVEQLDALSATDACDSTSGQNELQSDLEAALELAFSSEMLLRVLGAVFTAHDHAAGCEGSAATVGRHLLVLQLHARQKALSVLVHEQLTLCDVARIDRLRRQIERWTDLLLGPLVLRHDTGEFAFEAKRAREFGRDYFDDQTSDQQQWTWQLLLAGLHSSFAESQSGYVSQHHFTQQVGLQRLCDAIIKCVPADAFESDGLLRGQMAVRIGRSGLKPETAPQPTSSDAFRNLLAPVSSTQPSGEKGISFSKIRRKQRPAT